MYHLHTLPPGGNGTTKYSKIALQVFTLETYFMNVVHDLIGSGESFSEVTYLFPMVITNTHITSFKNA